MNKLQSSVHFRASRRGLCQLCGCYVCHQVPDVQHVVCCSGVREQYGSGIEPHGYGRGGVGTVQRSSQYSRRRSELSRVQRADESRKHSRR